ncbi:MAG: hypothetical protein ACXVFU_12885 [Nocardioidaceae bacterium]
MTGSVWRSRALVLLGLWLGTCVVVSIFGARPSYGLVALVVAAGGAVVLLFLDVSARSEPATWRLPGEDSLRPPGEDPRFALLRRVVAGHLDSHRVDGTLHTHLMAVADQRLLAHHGVHRLADPDRAAVLMGPELTAFARATQPFPRLGVREIAVLIDRIEDL